VELPEYMQRNPQKLNDTRGGDTYTQFRPAFRRGGMTGKSVSTLMFGMPLHCIHQLGDSLMNARVIQSIGAIALCFGANSSLYGVTISFQEDVSPTGGYQQIQNTIRNNGSISLGTGGSNQIGKASTTTGDFFRSLAGFDISAIPAGSTIDSVTLTLFPRNNGTAANTVDALFEIEVHQLIGSITEAGSTWANRENTGPVAWTTPGGDFSATVLSSLSANPRTLVTNASSYTFSSTSDFVTAAQGALDGSGTLYMILLAPVMEAGSVVNRFDFASDDTAGIGAPMLTVNYTVPEPNTISLLAGMGVAGIALQVLRRRKVTS
jgi:hypothetical protein